MPQTSSSARSVRRLLSAGWRPLGPAGSWLPPASPWVALAFECPSCSRVESMDPVRVGHPRHETGPEVHACPTRGCETRFAVTVVHAAVGWSLLVDGMPRSNVYWSPTHVRSFLRTDQAIAEPLLA